MADSGIKGKRILIVEDEPIICEICIKVLAREGYEVEVAANGWEGEVKIGEKGYDLILIDLRTPVVDGKQLYQLITQKYPEMVDRVILTSGEVMGGEIQSFLEEAGRTFLPKPFTPAELKRVVRDTLAKIDR